MLEIEENSQSPSQSEDYSEAETDVADSPPVLLSRARIHRAKTPFLDSESEAESTGRGSSKKKGPRKVLRDASGRAKLQRVCDKGKYDEAKQLIEKGANVNDADYAGNTALHEAALGGHTRIVELLLDNGAMVDVQNGPYDRDTPLIDAVSNGHVDTVKFLLERGANPTICNSSGQNAFDSVENEDPHKEELEALLKQFARVASVSKIEEPQSILGSSKNVTSWVDFTTKEGREEIFRRAAEGDEMFVANYLSNGGKPHDDALFLAAHHGHSGVVSLLLGFGGNVNASNNNGVTALMHSVGRGHINTVKLLLEAGANASMRDKGMVSALTIAKEGAIVDAEEIKLLVDALGQDPKEKTPNEDIYEENASKKERHETKNHQEKARESSKVKDKNQKDRDSEKIGPEDKDRGETTFKEKLMEDSRSKMKKAVEEGAEEKAEKKKNQEKEDSNEILTDRTLNDRESSSSGMKTEGTIMQSKGDHGVHDISRNQSSVPGSHEVTEADRLRRKSDVERSSTPRMKFATKDANSPSEKALSPSTKATLEQAELPSTTTDGGDLDVAARKRKFEKSPSPADQRQKEVYEAQKLERKRRRQLEIMSSIAADQKRKEEERKFKLQQAHKMQSEKQQLAAKEEKESLERQDQDRQVEDLKRKREIRKQYPMCIQAASFHIGIADQTLDFQKKYLPIFYCHFDQESWCVDLQIIMLFGLENFHQMFPTLTKRRMDEESKARLWASVFFPMIGHDTTRAPDIDHLVKMRQSDGAKFENLQLNWIKLEEVKQLVNQKGTSSNVAMYTELDLDHVSLAFSVPITSDLAKLEQHQVTPLKLPIHLSVRPKIEQLIGGRKMW